MKRALLILLLTTAPAFASHHPIDVNIEDENVINVPPMGVVIDERWPEYDFRDIVRLVVYPTDINCERFDAKYGPGHAAKFMRFIRR